VTSKLEIDSELQIRPGRDDISANNSSSITIQLTLGLKQDLLFPTTFRWIPP